MKTNGKLYWNKKKNVWTVNINEDWFEFTSRKNAEKCRDTGEVVDGIEVRMLGAN